MSECSICINIIKDTDAIFITPCVHKFHRDCLSKYVKIKNIEIQDCPNCRQPFSFTELEELMDLRENAISAFRTVLTKIQNCDIFEKLIFNQIYKSNPQKFDVDTYKWCVFNVIGYLFKESDKKRIADDVKQGKIGWKSPIYDNISAKIDEFDEYLVKPFDVVEGVNECGKCGSKKTWNVQKQVRSSDEPMTTFSRCVNCGNQWSYSG